MSLASAATPAAVQLLGQGSGLAPHGPFRSLGQWLLELLSHRAPESTGHWECGQSELRWAVKA